MLDFLLITSIVCIITIWIQSKPFIWRGKGIPWKIPLPLVGNTVKLFFNSWHVFWEEFYSSLGNERISGFHFFSDPALIIKDPALLKKVMISDADHFTGREFHMSESDPMGKSLFFASGKLWKSQRTRMTPYFTPSRVRSMIPFIQPITDSFTQSIAEDGKKGPIDTRPMSLKLATDVIMSNVFGLQPDAFKNPNSFFYNLQNELIGFDTGLRAMLSIVSPSIYDFFGFNFFRWNTNEKLAGFVNDVISQRSKGIGVRPDFMQGMIELMEPDDKHPDDNGTAKNKSNTSYKFDKTTVVGQCMLMYTAGTETTGNTLSFLLYELALNQSVQDKLRNEINAVLMKGPGDLTDGELNSLPYLDQVISETLRKYPIATVIGRKCTKAYNLDGIELAEGTVIVIPIVAIHHDPNNFPNPMKFDPQRFSPDSSITPGTYLPFGQGPRTCIGMKFAQTEIMLSLCKLLPKFRLLPHKNTPKSIIYTANPTLSSATPLWITVKPLE